MATGTGKTLTGLSAVVRLYQHVKKRTYYIYSVSLSTLVSQWVEGYRKL